MKSIFSFSVAVMMLIPFMASAQKQSDPEGYLTYSLPSTTIMLEVEGTQEIFHVGPYAKYAEKYLGIKVRQKNDTTICLSQVRMTPLVEADQNNRYTLDMRGKKNGTSLLRLSTEGLIAFSDAQYDGPMEWRFPTPANCCIPGQNMSANLSSATATLYHNGGKVSNIQHLLVGKSTEQKAAEAAQMILKLRTQRMQIVTGDTDATFDGEAMGSAIAEIVRLEQEYMNLFTGYSEYHELAMRFDVIPDAEQEEQMYVAFYLSNEIGLAPAEYAKGKPIMMQIIPQEIVVPEVPMVEGASKKVESYAYYRIPAVSTVRLIADGTLLLQTRMPIYQLGLESSIPVSVILK